jgi:hypothetical protein
MSNINTVSAFRMRIPLALDRRYRQTRRKIINFHGIRNEYCVANSLLLVVVLPQWRFLSDDYFAEQCYSFELPRSFIRLPYVKSRHSNEVLFAKERPTFSLYHVFFVLTNISFKIFFYSIYNLHDYYDKTYDNFLNIDTVVEQYCQFSEFVINLIFVVF